VAVLRLEHVTIRCAQLARTRAFYVDLIGLYEGARPDFSFRGHWLYLDDTPVIHLVVAADTGGLPDGAAGTGAFDHVAFRGEDFAAMQAKFQAAGIAFRQSDVPGGLKQLFVRDPEGVLVEINFAD
jgi:catechol 2,3-dioxygenase-like lactoylglutathione lyase family enzyme